MLNYDMENILLNIKKMREKFGFSQEYVAESIGLKQASYALIEAGKRELKYRQLQQIAITFGVNVIDIITYPEKFVKAEDGNKKRRLMVIELDDEEYNQLVVSKIK